MSTQTIEQYGVEFEVEYEIESNKVWIEAVKLGNDDIIQSISIESIKDFRTSIEHELNMRALDHVISLNETHRML